MNTTTVAKAAWSYSRLKNHETCPRRSLHYDILRDIKEPESEQLRAGNALHAHFAKRLSEGTPLPLGYGMYENMLAKILAAPGTRYTEQRLAITAELAPTSYFAPDVWFRTVVDLAVVSPDNTTAAIFDWKDGKVKDDPTQLQLMALAIFAHMPTLARVRAALMFVQHKQVERADFLRDDRAEIMSEILPRVRELDVARATNHYPPKPSGLCLKYCAVSSCEFNKKGKPR